MGVAADPALLRSEWEPFIDGVLREATLTRPESHVGTGRRQARTAHRVFWVHAG